MNLFIAIPIAFILLLVVILYRPFLGLMLVIAVNQLEYCVLIGAGWSMGRLLEMAVAFGWFRHIITRRGTKVFEGGVTNILLILYIVITAVGVLASVNPASEFSSVIKLAILIVMVFFIQDLIESRRQLIVLAWAIAVSYGLSAVPAILQFRGMTSGAEVVGVVRLQEEGYRFAGLYSNPNQLALMLVVGVPFLVLLLCLDECKLPSMSDCLCYTCFCS